MIPTRQQLEDGRNRGFIKYGYFWSFCELNRSCEQCDKTIRIGCVMKRKIEEFQTKRILHICKPDPPKKAAAEVTEPAEEEDPDPIIQHVGYSDAECGREK